ncbi:MAG: hypothetical protein DVB22_001563 [Verrucomicrobia bacterium]|jgi:hypothetical protein|nr:MAG: hypothetical protein DVB22_001563 [Verrucomicrobiota bacterium]
MKPCCSLTIILCAVSAGGLLLPVAESAAGVVASVPVAVADDGGEADRMVEMTGVLAKRHRVRRSERVPVRRVEVVGKVGKRVAWSRIWSGSETQVLESGQEAGVEDLLPSGGGLVSEDAGSVWVHMAAAPGEEWAGERVVVEREGLSGGDAVGGGSEAGDGEEGGETGRLADWERERRVPEEPRRWPVEMVRWAYLLPRD